MASEGFRGGTRYRLNAKQTAKGLWHLDVTLETESPMVEWHGEKGTLEATVTRMIQDTRAEFTKHGFRLADEAEP